MTGEVRLRPPGFWPELHLRELVSYRGLLRGLFTRDVRLRYRQTALGPVWIVAQPLMTALVFAFVFGHVAHLDAGGQPYVLVTFLGLLAWNLFAGTVTRCSNSMIQHAPLLTKIYFPRLCIPLSAALSALLDMIVSAGVLVVMLAGFGVEPQLRTLAAVPLLTAVFLLALGLGAALSALVVRYRDVQFVLPLLLQMLLFLSPVAYSAGQLSAQTRRVVYLNPLAPLVEGVRWSVLGGRAPSTAAFVSGGVLSGVVLLAGLFVFARRERSFADDI